MFTLNAAAAFTAPNQNVAFSVKNNKTVDVSNVELRPIYYSIAIDALFLYMQNFCCGLWLKKRISCSKKMFSCMKHSLQLIFSIPFHASSRERLWGGGEDENCESSKCKECFHVLSAFVVCGFPLHVQSKKCIESSVEMEMRKHLMLWEEAGIVSHPLSTSPDIC